MEKPSVLPPLVTGGNPFRDGRELEGGVTPPTNPQSPNPTHPRSQVGRPVAAVFSPLPRAGEGGPKGRERGRKGRVLRPLSANPSPVPKGISFGHKRERGARGYPIPNHPRSPRVPAKQAYRGAART